MKLRFWVIMFSVMLAAGMGGTAFAFHSGGVADCDGCHSMHAQNGEAGATYNGPYLLQGVDQSSTCLNCHNATTKSSFHISTASGSLSNGAPLNYTPGGDFAWLNINFTYAGFGGTTTENGQDHGHNIVSTTYGYTADTNYTTAPGGTMVSTQLACNSCHDPHSPYRRVGTGAGTVATSATNSVPIAGSGSYNTSMGNSTTNEITAGLSVGVYRLLAGPGYSDSQTGSISYPGVPVAVAPSTYNQTENTAQVRVAYGDGRGNTNQTSWGNWCGTCHPGFLTGASSHVHPIDVTMATGTLGAFGAEATNYLMYVSSGNLSGSFTGTAAGQGPFTSLVPFITGSGAYDTGLGPLASNAPSAAQLAGPVGGTDEVSCLTCHRAHASGFTHMLRWENDEEFLTIVSTGTTPVWPGTDVVPTPAATTSLGRTQAQWQAAYYGRPPTVFGPYQRSLCNKCHAKD